MGMMLASMAGVALVGGCTPSTDGDPKPTTTTKVAQADLWDPCTIPADALARTGVDPATAERDVAGVKQEGWKICAWRGRGYFLSIYSTNYSLDDVRKNPRNTAFGPATVGGREGVTYHETSDSKLRDCDIALGVPQGAVLISVVTSALLDQPTEDPCVTVLRHATDLEPLLPSSK